MWQSSPRKSHHKDSRKGALLLKNILTVNYDNLERLSQPFSTSFSRTTRSRWEYSFSHAFYFPISSSRPELQYSTVYICREIYLSVPFPILSHPMLGKAYRAWFLFPLSTVVTGTISFCEIKKCDHSLCVSCDQREGP